MVMCLNLTFKPSIIRPLLILSTFTILYYCPYMDFLMPMDPEHSHTDTPHFPNVPHTPSASRLLPKHFLLPGMPFPFVASCKSPGPSPKP